MTEALLFLAGLLLILAAGYIALRGRMPTTAQRSPRPPAQLTPQAQLYRLQQAGKFWGVSVESHCRASSGLAGLKFPLDAAPPLPVEGCEATACRCTYIGLVERRAAADRRTGSDRRNGLRMDSPERRSGRPRRARDLDSWQHYRHL